VTGPAAALAGVYWPDRREAAAAPQFVATKQAPGLWISCNGGATAESRALFCAIDGRVDHRTPTAAAVLALECYRESGIAGLGRLVGDWSLTLWDSGAETLVLASDYAGARPLYYCPRDGGVAWSSSLDRLVRRMGCRELDPDYVTAFLSTGFPRQRTPYRGVYPVPAGSAIFICAGKTAVVPIWNPPAQTIHYGNEARYEEQFRELFREAVAVRLSDASPVSCELSGGLDSSSIVCMADRLVSSASVSCGKLVTFSYFTPESPDHRYIGLAEQACRSITPVHLDAYRFPLLAPETPGGTLPIWAEARLREVRRLMEKLGSTTFLTGQLGDLITGNALDDSEQAADFLCRLRLRDCFKEALAWSRSLRVPVYGLLARAAKAAWAACRSRTRNATPSRQKRLAGLADLRASRFFQCPEPLDDVLYSHPFTHRPLVEFLLSVPSGILCRPGEPRRLMRKALKGIVPDAILCRRSKGNYEDLFLHSLRPCARELLSSLPLWLARLGWVDGRQTLQRLESISRGLPFGQQIPYVIRLEHWIRQGIRRGAIAAGQSGLPELGIT
jgi:asparagine synthase (glutamine-hydrolysing)